MFTSTPALNGSTSANINSGSQKSGSILKPYVFTLTNIQNTLKWILLTIYFNEQNTGLPIAQFLTLTVTDATDQEQKTDAI